MKKARTNLNFTSYLDVSQFIIKEHSPLIKPSSPQHHHSHENHLAQETPEIAPIDHDTTQFYLTPLTSTLIPQQILQSLEDFILDSGMDNFPQNKTHAKKKRSRSYEAKTCLTLQMFRLDSELERIIQDDEQNSNYISEEYSESESSEDIDKEDFGYTISSCAYSSWGKSKSKDYSLRDTEQQRQSTIDLSIVDYSQTIDRFNKNPKLEILKKIREIDSFKDVDEEERKMMIKKYLEKYLLEYETHCFEESWKELNQNISTTVKTLINGIEETFSKKVGFLPFESRRVKLLKYLEKKKRRIWRKKVSYDCRKKVADGRLRIKGKFVTREQACEQLGLESLDNYSAEQIKQMLQRRIDESLSQQLVC